MASHILSSAVPIAGSSNNTTTGATAPHGASATSTAAASRNDSSNAISNNGTPNRLSRGNSFRIPLPPNSPSVGGGGGAGAVSPSSPGTAQSSSQLGTSYGSSSTGSRLGNFALGFRRNRGASTNRGDLTSPVAAPPSPPPPAFPSLQASTSLTDFGVSPYFDGGGTATDNNNMQATSPSAGQHNPSSSISSSTTRGYFTRRGFGRKNTGGLLSGNRTPTSEQPPSLSAMQRSRSSSQPSLPLSVANGAQQQVASANTPANATGQQQQQLSAQSANANAVNMVLSGTSQAGVVSNSLSTSANNPRNGGSSSTDSSRRPSGEATRTPASATLPTSSSSSSAMQGRTASQAQAASNSAPPTATTAPSNSNAAPAASASASTSISGETQHIRLVPHLESTRSLHFDPISRDILPTIPLRIGRFTDRNPNQPISALDQNRVAFKSKVVSRTHAEIWFEPPSSTSNTNSNNSGNGWFIRDLKSSSGTFLNHIRLSGAGMESRPFPIRDGDVLQLGVDYQGGTEEIYRCVKMRIELNRGWQRGANSFNTNALRQIRALGNVGEQASSSTGETSQKKKSKKSKHGKKHQKKKSATSKKEDGDADMDINDGDDGTASDGMQVDKKEKEKKNHTQPSGVTDCCICLFSVTVYQALFIAPCSHIFHFKCIRPLLMQHHPGFSCPLCRTFGDLEADVEQDDVPEPVQEESSSSSSSSGESESEDAEEQVEGVQGAPALPDKDAPATASVNAPNLDPASTSENTAVLHTNAISLTSSDPNLDTLRPGRKSPFVPSVSEFGTVGSSNAQNPGRISTSSNRPSFDAVRPPSGTRTPPSRGSRVASFQSAPPSGAAVAAALEGHVTPNNSNHHHHHHHHSHHHSGGGEGSFNPPSAGDFDPDIRRGSIYVHGADGHAMHIPITGRSRPSSVYEGDISSDAHPQHHHHHHHNAPGNTQSPSVSAAEKNKARSVKSMRMTKSKNSTNSLRSAAAASASATSPSGASSSVSALGHRRRASAPSSDEEEDEGMNMDEEPLTARPMPGAVSAPGEYPFPDSTSQPTSSNEQKTEDAHMENNDEEEQDNTPPSSHQEDSESASDIAVRKGKGKETTSPPSGTSRDIGSQQDRQTFAADSSKQSSDDAITASVHAIV